jgi:hypothetical protein
LEGCLVYDNKPVGWTCLTLEEYVPSLDMLSNYVVCGNRVRFSSVSSYTPVPLWAENQQASYAATNLIATNGVESFTQPAELHAVDMSKKGWADKHDLSRIVQFM